MSDAAPQFRWYRVFLMLLIASLVAAALVGIVALFGPSGRPMDRVLATTGSVALFSLTSLGCAFCWNRTRWRPVAAVGLVLAALSFPLFLAGIWVDWYTYMGWRANEIVSISMAVGAIWSVLMPHLCLLALARLRKGWGWTRYGTQTTAAVLALCLTIAIMVEPHDDDDVLRVLGTLAILTACGTICVPILHWVSATRSREAVVTTSLTLTLACPRCGLSQELPAGRSRCRQCGLSFRIEIEEEHCAKCGYVLYRLTSDRCPECGTPVPWATTSNAAPLTTTAPPQAAQPSAPPPAA